MKLFKQNRLYGISVGAIMVLLLLLLWFVTGGEIRIGPKRPVPSSAKKEVVEKVFFKPEGVTFPKTLTVKGKWKVTINSCRFLPEKRNLRFNLLVENLQDGIAGFAIDDETNLVDHFGNTYRVSKISPRGKISIYPGVAEKFQISFLPEFEEGVKAVLLYLYFWSYDVKSDEWSKWSFEEPSEFFGMKPYVGPIKLENIPQPKKN